MSRVAIAIALYPGLGRLLHVLQGVQTAIGFSGFAQPIPAAASEVP